MQRQLRVIELSFQKRRDSVGDGDLPSAECQFTINIFTTIIAGYLPKANQIAESKMHINRIMNAAEPILGKDRNLPADTSQITSCKPSSQATNKNSWLI